MVIIAEGESTVLIEGENGMSKELFARAVHEPSPRQNGPSVVVNCGALPDTLLAPGLLRYKKGAFTDASGISQAGSNSPSEGSSSWMRS